MEGHFISGKWARSKVRARTDWDPAPVVNTSQVILKRCPHCKRVQHVHISARNEFHMCCEGHQMAIVGRLDKAVELQRDLTRAVRKFDFVLGRPKSNVHKPSDKARSKLPK